MKYLKSFNLYKESVGIDDGNMDDDATFDHSNNPVLKLKVQEYVRAALYSKDEKVILDALGIKKPDDLESGEEELFFNDVEEKAIKYFMKHPHKMPTIDEFETKNQTQINVDDTNDGLADGRIYIPKTNNIGQQ